MNAFEIRREAMNNTREVSPEEAMTVVYNSLDRIQRKDLEFGIFVDQDGGRHLVLLSDKYDAQQLFRLYNNFYMVGSICNSRSALYWGKREARLRVVMDHVAYKVSEITVASVIQRESYVVDNDMLLMSECLAWLYGK